VITEQQYQTLMKTLRENGRVVSRAALKAAMHRKTAGRYVKGQQSPAERRAAAPKQGRTRPNPIPAAMWESAKGWLEETPELDRTLLFEHLLEGHAEWVPSAAASLRTFQRHAKQWCELHGPPKEPIFRQVHKPGEYAEFDWTHVREDNYTVTIAGIPFKHLLTHFVLPYSNWQWATPCQSECTLSLRRGVQDALWRLGAVPPVTQTDCSSSATHTIEDEKNNKKRELNESFVEFCKHLGTEPRTIHVHSPNENADVESSHGHLKRRIKNHLKLRGSNDFATVEEYAAFVANICERANKLRVGKLAEELPLFGKLPARRYPETHEITTTVSRESTISVNKVPYTVPSRLIGAEVTIHAGEHEISVFRRGTPVLTRVLATADRPGIDYRHLIDWLVKKAGAFRRYVYREHLFPDIRFRQGHEALRLHDPARADKEYLKLLQLAAEGSEAEVSEAIGECLRQEKPPLLQRIERVLARRARNATRRVQSMEPFVPNLAQYDELLQGVRP
jgi:hypothetical protein